MVLQHHPHHLSQLRSSRRPPRCRLDHGALVSYTCWKHWEGEACQTSGRQAVSCYSTESTAVLQTPRGRKARKLQKNVFDRRLTSTGWTNAVWTQCCIPEGVWFPFSRKAGNMFDTVVPRGAKCFSHAFRVFDWLDADDSVSLWLVLRKGSRAVEATNARSDDQPSVTKIRLVWARGLQADRLQSEERQRAKRAEVVDLEVPSSRPLQRRGFDLLCSPFPSCFLRPAPPLPLFWRIDLPDVLKAAAASTALQHRYA